MKVIKYILGEEKCMERSYMCREVICGEESCMEDRDKEELSIDKR